MAHPTAHDDFEGDEETVIPSPTPWPRPTGDDAPAPEDGFIGKRPSWLRRLSDRITGGKDYGDDYWPTVGDLRLYAQHMKRIESGQCRPKAKPHRLLDCFDPELTGITNATPEEARRHRIRMVRDHYRAAAAAEAPWWTRYA